LLSDIIGLRNALKKQIVGCGVGNVWVLDACCVAGCKNTANIDQRLECLKAVMASDNVHYLSEGYASLVENCTAALRAHGTGEVATNHSSKAMQFFWRGFRSPIGAKVTAKVTASMSGTRGRGNVRGRRGKIFHPYRRY
jgi:hypothetical protein